MNTMRRLPRACVMLLAAAAAGGFDAGATPAQPLAVAVDYVVPAAAPGAKFRTPDTIDTALAGVLAKRWQRPLSFVSAANGAPSSPAHADIALTMLDAAHPAAAGQVAIDTGYRAGPMAIMRSDTRITRWEQLRGHTVCVAEGGRHAGTLAAQYGALEKRYRAPADALIALRTGQCDAAVDDNTLLEELLKLPEWKKFSARLPTGPQATLAFLVPATDTHTVAALKQIADDWKRRRTPDALMKTAVRNIAFEVYLDQDVPDCH